MTIGGNEPFTLWMETLPAVARIKIYRRLARTELGNFGDRKSLAGTGGIYELRKHASPGYCIYYRCIGQRVVLILAGSAKSSQNKAMEAAKGYWAAYERKELR